MRHKRLLGKKHSYSGQATTLIGLSKSQWNVTENVKLHNDDQPILGNGSKIRPVKQINKYLIFIVISVYVFSYKLEYMDNHGWSVSKQCRCRQKRNKSRNNTDATVYMTLSVFRLGKVFPDVKQISYGFQKWTSNSEQKCTKILHNKLS